MIKVMIDKDTSLAVDFHGLLSPREEEVIAHRMAGKNKVAVAEIFGTKPDTVNKQCRSIYKKCDVDGTDNPLACLMCRAFQKRWATFMIWLLIFFSFPPCLRTNWPARSVVVTARRTNEFDMASGTG